MNMIRHHNERVEKVPIAIEMIQIEATIPAIAGWP